MTGKQLEIMKKLVLSIPFYFIALFANAQHTVSGIVTDKYDVTLLLEGVNVFIPELNKSDVTKEGGTYIVRNVGIGVVHLQFSKSGYKTEVRTISTKDSAVVVSIDMEKSILMPDEITQSSLNSSLSGNTIFPLAVYSSKELSKNATLDPLSALSYNAETEVVNDGNSNIHLTIRGSGLDRIAYYTEGNRMNNNAWDDKYSLGINFNGTQSLEVVTGPAALLYGSNASSGVLIMHEEKAEISGNRSGDVKFKFNSNTMGLDGEAGFKGTFSDGWFYSLRIGAQSHTSYIQGEGDEVTLNTEERPFASNSKYNSTNGKFALGLNKKWGMSKISYSRFDQKSGVIQVPEEAQNLADGIEREREITAPYQELMNDLIRSNTTILTGRSKINFDLSYQSNANKTHENNFNGVLENTDAIDYSALNYDLKYTSDALKSYVFTVGSQGGMSNSDNSGTFSRFADAEESNLSLYGLVKYNVKRWNFQLGGRFDFKEQELRNYTGINDTSSSRPSIAIKKEYSNQNGSFGISYQPIKMLMLKGSVSTGFTPPNYNQLTAYTLHSRLNRFEIGNAALAMEKNIQADLGAQIEFPAIAIELKGYSNMITDYIYAYNTGADTIIPIDSNSVDTFSVFGFDQADAKINGLEVAVTVNPPTAKWFKLQLSYAFIEGKFNSGGYLPYIPANKLMAALTISGEKMNYVYKPFVSVLARNYSERKNVAESELTNEGYLLLDFQIGGSFRWGKQLFDIEVSANNLLNTNYFNQFSLTRSLGPNGVYDMGRNVSLQLHIPFGLNK